MADKIKDKIDEMKGKYEIETLESDEGDLYWFNEFEKDCKELIKQATELERKDGLGRESNLLHKICSYMEQFSKDLENGMEERQAIVDFQEVMNEFVDEKIKELKNKINK